MVEVIPLLPSLTKMLMLPRPITLIDISAIPSVRPPHRRRSLEEVVRTAWQVKVAAEPNTLPFSRVSFLELTASLLTLIVSAQLPRLSALQAVEQEVDRRIVAAPVAVTKHAPSKLGPLKLEVGRDTTLRQIALHKETLDPNTDTLKQITIPQEKPELPAKLLSP